MKLLFKKMINESLAYLDLEVVRKKPSMPVEANEFEKSLISECARYSMTGNIRMWSLMQAMKHIHNNSIKGDVVECGVWKGGNLGLMRRFMDHKEMMASVIGFDTFEGMSEPTSHDEDIYGNVAKNDMQKAVKDETINNFHAFASIDQVRNNLKNLGAEKGVVLVKGKVEDTLSIKSNIPKKIALLRLDTDWYESTMAELNHLYPRLVSGGVLIIDDYGHFKGAKKAVDEYFMNQSIWMHYVDYTCRLIVKP